MGTRRQNCYLERVIPRYPEYINIYYTTKKECKDILSLSQQDTRTDVKKLLSLSIKWRKMIDERKYG